MDLGYMEEYLEEEDYDGLTKAIYEAVWELRLLNNPEDFPRIIEYEKRAADAGSDEAMNQLGAIYDEGVLVVRDPEESFRWYKKAAENGNPLAMSNLGFCYLYGKGTDVDEPSAFKAFSKAALWDVGDAIIRLGDMYRYGKSVEKDGKTAWMLYQKARVLAEADLNDWGNQQVYSDVLRRLGDWNYSEKDFMRALWMYSQAMYYYAIRKRKGDFYCGYGYAKTKEQLAKVIDEIARIEEE